MYGIEKGMIILWLIGFKEWDTFCIWGFKGRDYSLIYGIQREIILWYMGFKGRLLFDIWDLKGYSLMCGIQREIIL